MAVSKENRMTLVILRGELAGLPEDDQAKVREAAALIRDLVKERGAHMVMALAIVAAEVNAEELKVG